MHRAAILASATLAVVLAGCNAPDDRWAIEPGPVHYADGLISGTYTLVRDINGIASDRLGGACLVADLSRQRGPEACETDRDCNPVAAVQRGPGNVQAPPLPDWYGYCAVDHPPVGGPGAGSAPRGGPVQRCWYKPNNDPAYCNKGQVLEAGRSNFIGPASPRPPGTASPIRWRVHACLNPRTPPGTKPACANEDDDSEATSDGAPIRIN